MRTFIGALPDGGLAKARHIAPLVVQSVILRFIGGISFVLSKYPRESLLGQCLGRPPTKVGLGKDRAGLEQPHTDHTFNSIVNSVQQCEDGYKNETAP